jgi:hypothetical protein
MKTRSAPCEKLQLACNMRDKPDPYLEIEVGILPELIIADANVEPECRHLFEIHYGRYSGLDEL